MHATSQSRDDASDTDETPPFTCHRHPSGTPSPVDTRSRPDGSSPIEVGLRIRAVAWYVSLHYEDAQVAIHRLVVGPIDNNVFVVCCKATGEALLVDAANEPDLLLETCQALNVRQIVETHGHWDHIQAVPALREAGYKVAVSAQDARMLPAYDELLKDDDVIAVGGLRIHAIHTPGHTPGSMCFAVDGSPVLFSGDTLFPGGPGNTTFPGGNFAQIISSIDRRLFVPLPPETIVMPGHGANTTIGTERPHLDEWIQRGW
jgi:glyoxylase-like metal-dependent hydrolase (beta-lactamase superfamily II)